MKRLVLGVMVLCAASVAVLADDRPAGEDEAIRWLKLDKGTPVRLMVEDGGPMREVVGRLLSSDATTVTVDAEGGPQRLSRDRLFHLQYLTGGRDHKKGAQIGAAITGAVGFIAGLGIGIREVRGEARAQGGAGARNDGWCAAAVRTPEPPMRTPGEVSLVP